MKLKITNPTDSFDMVEIIDFKYVGIPRQNSIKQLTIRAIKFKLNDDESSSYSDEPPFEIFIKDLDAYLESDLLEGKTQRYGSFVSVIESIGSILKDKFSLEYELI
jgi:hypothetical protein